LLFTNVGTALKSFWVDLKGEHLEGGAYKCRVRFFVELIPSRGTFFDRLRMSGSKDSE